jgi:hypothetical protein
MSTDEQKHLSLVEDADVFAVNEHEQEGLRLRVPPRYAPPKTKVGEIRCAGRDELKKHSKWVAGVDPMNIVLVGAAIAVPVIGATMLLLLFAAIVLALIVILW